MRPIKIDGADPRPLGAPPDWDEHRDGHCAALFVRRDQQDGVAFMRSAWEVEAAEAMYMFAGARLVLGVSGNCHPVVNLGVEGLPPDFEPVVFARPCLDSKGTPAALVDMLFSHGGGRRAFILLARENRTFAATVALAIPKIEELARREGWIK